MNGVLPKAPTAAPTVESLQRDLTLVAMQFAMHESRGSGAIARAQELSRKADGLRQDLALVEDALRAVQGDQQMIGQVLRNLEQERGRVQAKLDELQAAEAGRAGDKQRAGELDKTAALTRAAGAGAVEPGVMLSRLQRRKLEKLNGKKGAAGAAPLPDDGQRVALV